MLDIYLDVAVGGRVMAHLLDPPGLGVRYESREAMARGLPADLAAHLDWLRRHGQTVSEEPVAYRLAAEGAIGGNFESGDDVGFYRPDAQPVTAGETQDYLRIAGYAHDDLLALVGDLDDAALDWVRDDRTRPIRGILRHVAGAELWYMTRIIDDPGVAGVPEVIAAADARCDATEDMRERVRIVWRAFQQWARSLTPAQRERVVVPTWYAHAEYAERWTARKVLRRCIEHCREHTRSIERLLEDCRSRAPGGSVPPRPERF